MSLNLKQHKKTFYSYILKNIELNKNVIYFYINPNSTFVQLDEK